MSVEVRGGWPSRVPQALVSGQDARYRTIEQGPPASVRPLQWLQRTLRRSETSVLFFKYGWNTVNRKSSREMREQALRRHGWNTRRLQAVILHVTGLLGMSPECVGGSASALTREQMAAHMRGRTIEDFFPAPPRVPSGEIRLRVRGLRGSVIDDFALDAHAGEIIGVAGLAGMGQAELVRLLAPADVPCPARSAWTISRCVFTRPRPPSRAGSRSCPATGTAMADGSEPVPPRM